MVTSFRKKEGFGLNIGLKQKRNVNLPIKEFTGKNKMKIEVLTEDQLLKVLPVIDESVLAILVKNNEIPYFYTGKKSLRFRVDSIRKWLNDLEKKAGVA
jgi:hypothetical protein